MTVADDKTLKVKPRTGRRNAAVRNEVMEMHLFDAEVAEEKALCGEDSSPVERMSVGYYLEERLCGRPVGTVCQECKTLAMPLAEVIARESVAGGLAHEAEEYHWIAVMLRRETG